VDWWGGAQVISSGDTRARATTITRGYIIALACASDATSPRIRHLFKLPYGIYSSSERSQKRREIRLQSWEDFRPGVLTGT
jgi:hypothetical protein